MEVFAGREVIEQSEVLEPHAGRRLASSDCDFSSAMAHTCKVPDSPTRGSIKQAGEHLDGGRFPRPIGTEEAVKGASFELSIRFHPLQQNRQNARQPLGLNRLRLYGKLRSLHEMRGNARDRYMDGRRMPRLLMPEPIADRGENTGCIQSATASCNSGVSGDELVLWR